MSESEVYDPTLYIRPDACNAAFSFPGMTTRFECECEGYDGRPHDQSGAPVDRWHEYTDETEQFSVSWRSGSPYAYRFDRVTGRRLEP